MKAKEATGEPGAKDVCRWYVSFVRTSGGTTYPAGTRTRSDRPYLFYRDLLEFRYFLREFLLTILWEKFIGLL